MSPVRRYSVRSETLSASATSAIFCPEARAAKTRRSSAVSGVCRSASASRAFSSAPICVVRLDLDGKRASRSKRMSSRGTSGPLVPDDELLAREAPEVRLTIYALAS